MVDKNATNKLQDILREYAELPAYSLMGTPTVYTKSLFGGYPINIAAVRGSVEEVTTLLAYGSDINASGEHGYTPLHEAVEQGHIEVVQLLLKKGASTDICNESGQTPLDIAVLGQEKEILHVLQSYQIAKNTS